MTKKKTPKSLDDTASYKILKAAPYEKEQAKAQRKPPKQSPEALALQAVKVELDRAYTVLDVINRENHPGLLGDVSPIEYGQKHPAVESVRALRQRCKDLEEKLLRVPSNVVVVDTARVEKLEAWIREASRTGTVNHATLAEVLKL